MAKAKFQEETFDPIVPVAAGDEEDTAAMEGEVVAEVDSPQLTKQLASAMAWTPRQCETWLAGIPQTTKDELTQAFANPPAGTAVARIVDRVADQKRERK